MKKISICIAIISFSFAFWGLDARMQDVFEALRHISEDALEKLRRFSNAANKPTGSHHPLDEGRWFDFIIQTVRDDRLIGSDTLARYLVDGEAWGEREGFSGGMASNAWDCGHAHALAAEYEQYVNFLQYDREHYE